MANYSAVAIKRIHRSGTPPVPNLNKGNYDNGVFVGSDFLFSYSLQQSQKALWIYKENQGLIFNPSITIGDGKIFFLESMDKSTLTQTHSVATLKQFFSKGAKLVALDAKNGKRLWEKQITLPFEHGCYLSYADNRLIISGSYNKDKACFYSIFVHDAKNGSLTWSKEVDPKQKARGSHGEQDRHAVLVKGVLYLEPFALDLQSGDFINWQWFLGVKHRRGCGQLVASSNQLFFRHKTLAMFDLETKKHSAITQVTRTGCWVNVIPAGGLLLAPEASSGCRCNYGIQTSIGFLPK